MLAASRPFPIPLLAALVVAIATAGCTPGPPRTGGVPIPAAEGAAYDGVWRGATPRIREPYMPTFNLVVLRVANTDACVLVAQASGVSGAAQTGSVIPVDCRWPNVPAAEE